MVNMANFNQFVTHFFTIIFGSKAWFFAGGAGRVSFLGSKFDEPLGVKRAVQKGHCG